MNVLTIILRNLAKRRLRTILTMLGVAVGVGLMFSLLSISASGTQRSLELIRRISGADIVIYNGTRVSPMGMMPEVQRSTRLFQPMAQQYLDIQIAEVISSIPGILTISPVLLLRANVASSEGLTTVIGVYGVDPSSYLEVSQLEVVEGRFLGGLGVYEAVIGRSLAEELGVSVGNSITLTISNSSTSFTIVGVYSAVNRFAENSIYIPIDVAQDMAKLSNKISQILIKCEDPSQAQEISQRILSLIQGVSVFVPSAIVQSVSQAINTITYFFSTIGLVAITAGIFGVMNTMTMAVSERTREIGIMKAVGATNRFILKLFLLESTILGFIGGITGIFVGVVLSYAIAPMLSQVGAQRFFGTPGRGGFVQPQVSFNLLITPHNIALALALGVVVGVIAGVYPAYRAYRLKPVEALRYV